MIQELGVDEPESKYISFYQKYRVQIWSAVFTIVGLFGGNVDRLDKLIPTNAVNEKLEDLEVRTQINTESIDSINTKLIELNRNVGEAIKEAKLKQ